MSPDFYKELQFLAYAYAPLPTTVEFIQNNWVKSSKQSVGKTEEIAKSRTI